MPRKPRIQFPGAIYHIVTRGDGKREIFHDADHYQRLTDGLAEEVKRSGWIVSAYCWMPNHIHLLLKTPEPNLSSGMQHWLSGYANWYAKRNQRTGHLFQGRFKDYLVEDESYFWNLSRYIHLNPCVGKRPLVEKPNQWEYSSYPGFVRKRQMQDFVDYDSVLNSWAGEYGGSDPCAGYRRFVSNGLKNGLENPLTLALDDWVIGSKSFLKRMVALAGKSSPDQTRRILRRTHSITPEEILELVANDHGVSVESYRGFRSSVPGREMAALLCRRLTPTTLADLSILFGLKHKDSSANLVRRAKEIERDSPKFKKRITNLEKRLLKTEKQV